MNIIKYYRLFKSLIFRFNLGRCLPSAKLELMANMSKLSVWINNNKKIPFSDFPTNKFDYSKRYKLYEYLISSQKLSKELDYLEFGVSKGVSFKWWMDKLTDTSNRFYGFDTFTGLPEDWGFFKKGDMHNDDDIPMIDDTRHKFYKGLFQDTIYDFLKEYKPNKRRIIHMDADIYSATIFVLNVITPYLKKDDIILFDEFNVPMHEFKAFSEWVQTNYIKYEVLGSVNNFYQVAMLLK